MREAALLPHSSVALHTAFKAAVIFVGCGAVSIPCRASSVTTVATVPSLVPWESKTCISGAELQLDTGLKRTGHVQGTGMQSNQGILRVGTDLGDIP